MTWGTSFSAKQTAILCPAKRADKVIHSIRSFRIILHNFVFSLKLGHMFFTEHITYKLPSFAGSSNKIVNRIGVTEFFILLFAYCFLGRVLWSYSIKSNVNLQWKKAPYLIPYIKNKIRDLLFTSLLLTLVSSSESSPKN